MEKLEVPIDQRPKLPCAECWNNPLRCQGKVGVLVWVYCEHTQSGAVRFWYKGQPWPWRVFSPITWEGYIGYLNELNQSFERLLASERKADEQMEEVLNSIPDEKFIKI